jgi:hypothetical protein
VSGNSRFQVRIYDSAPACFLLVIDDTVFVEQYHYGKLVPGQDEYPVVLGKNMPPVEYSHDSSDLYETDALRNSVELLKDHFEFVFERCSRPLGLTSLPPDEER